MFEVVFDNERQVERRLRFHDIDKAIAFINRIYRKLGLAACLELYRIDGTKKTDLTDRLYIS